MRIKVSAAFSALAVLTLTACSSGPSASEQRTSAKVDASTLGRDIAIWYVDNGDAPSVTLVDGVYHVEGATSEASLEGAVLTAKINGPVDWCVTVANADGTVAASYSAQRQMEDGATCD